MGEGVCRLEVMVIKGLFGNIYNGRNVVVTGHTGFKGSWLSLWLEEMGARVTGYALPANTSPSHFQLLSQDGSFPRNSVEGDVRNLENLRDTLKKAQPSIVFHLAAQSLVQESYDNPLETFETNILGTANLLECCRYCSTVKAVVIITSDKCYENKEHSRCFSEDDPLGGQDPYSASKGCAEVIAASYRSSYFPPEEYNSKHSTLVATARAGNVIGGGDWAQDRLIPDIARAVDSGEPVVIRNPEAIRPWQHVLDCLSGYLLLGQKLLEGDPSFAEAWNFGPLSHEKVPVQGVLERLHKHWPKLTYICRPDPNAFREAQYLLLDSSKSKKKLGWHPLWDLDKALQETAQWYRRYYDDTAVCSNEQLSEFAHTAQKGGLL